jgi:hypothetical protein
VKAVSPAGLVEFGEAMSQAPGMERLSRWPALLVSLTLLVGCGASGHSGVAARAKARSSSSSSRSSRGCHPEWKPDGYGDQGASLGCFHLPSSWKPRDASEAWAWFIPPGYVFATGRRLRGPQTYLVAWNGQHSGFAFRRRRNEHWQQAVRVRAPSGSTLPTVSLGDVTADGRTDVLVEGWEGGSGYCGDRTVFAVTRATIRRLFNHYACEQHSSFEDGFLYFREPLHGCGLRYSAHCYRGVRITIRGWAGTRPTTHEVLTRCYLRRFDPAHECAS